MNGHKDLSVCYLNCLQKALTKILTSTCRTSSGESFGLVKNNNNNLEHYYVLKCLMTSETFFMKHEVRGLFHFNHIIVTAVVFNTSIQH